MALGCVPATVDTTLDDYLSQRDSPQRLINDDGIYNGGGTEILMVSLIRTLRRLEQVLLKVGCISIWAMKPILSPVIWPI